MALVCSSAAAAAGPCCFLALPAAPWSCKGNLEGREKAVGPDDLLAEARSRMAAVLSVEIWVPQGPVGLSKICLWSHCWQQWQESGSPCDLLHVRPRSSYREFFFLRNGLSCAIESLSLSLLLRGSWQKRRKKKENRLGVLHFWNSTVSFSLLHMGLRHFVNTHNVSQT